MSSRRLLPVALLGFALIAQGQAAETPPLALEATIPLPDTRGRIDHLAVDLVRKKLFIAELGNGTIDVIDLNSRKVVHRINGLKEPQGIVYEPKSDLIAVASGGDGTLRLYSGKDYAPKGVVNLGDDADNVRGDPRNARLVVGYGSGALAVIDPAIGKKLRDIPLPAHPESFRLSGSQVFVNAPGAGKIVVADLDSGKVTATWTPEKLSSNFPMILDNSRRVAVVFRSPSRLALFDAATGRQVAVTETCGDADDLFFDAKRSRFYVTCGDGSIDVFKAAGNPDRIAQLSTAWGARTSLFVPELDRLFLAQRAGLLGSSASLAIYRPAD